MLKTFCKISSLFVLFQVLLCCSSRPKDNNDRKDYSVKQEGKKIVVSFMVDEISIKLKDDFKIYIMNGDETFECPPKDNYIELPTLNKDSGYSIRFEFEKYKLTFDNFTKKLITPKQNIEWRFGIDNRPFNNILGLLPHNEFKTDTTTKELHYLKYNLLEEGDGVQFVKKIK